ncbi:hypothetical protein ACP70R_021372 [Stipagrostis hirtigluma subsp. patula]
MPSSSSSSSQSNHEPPPLLLPPPEPAPTPPPRPEARPRPIPTVVTDTVRGLLRSGEALIRGVFRGNPGYPRPPQPVHHLHHHQQHNRPGDIVKRFNRETFSDVMKLLDKHEQLERILSLYKNGKGFQFPDLPIRVKIALDAVGALFLVDGDEFKQARSVLDKAGHRTGISSRFVFESKTRGKDTIAAELSTRLGAGGHHHGEATGRPVELTRLQYCARINKQLSMILVPLGAQCSNFLHDSGTIQNLQSQASFDGPPLFSEYHNCAAGLRIKGSKLTASFAELLFGSGAQDSERGGTNRVTTFCQVSCEPAKDVKLSLSGLWQVSSSSSRFNNLGMLAVPLGSMKPAPETHSESVANVPRSIELAMEVHGATSTVRSEQSVAVMVDCELYETIKAEGWFQMERPSHGPVCGFSLCDTPENELGWGVRMGGTAQGKRRHRLHRAHMEGFLNFNLGKGARLQPGFVYAMEGKKWTPALFLRSSWFM